MLEPWGLRDPMAVLAVVLAVVLGVVAVTLISRYQAKQHTIKKPLNLSN
jgi:ABC-type spermidine/putrescine transport system permease subunit II